MIDLHAVNNEITTLYSIETIVTIDSFMIHICKHSTAVRRKVWVITKTLYPDGLRPQRDGLMVENAICQLI